METILTDLGLIFGIVGTLLIAFSIGRHPVDENYSDGVNGERLYFIYLKSRCRFRVGLVFLALGFFLQLNIMHKLLIYIYSNIVVANI